ncbi:DUF541 domain-containing protein [Leucothrix sargassi]|nr:DUF541 domain-containing protein [Leucothrix sargassi]
MLQKVCATLCLITPMILAPTAMATPEIKGSPEEIQQYLTGIPKVISVTASSDQIVESNEARMSLLVNTESKKLSDALKKNYEVRKSLRKQLNALGVSDSNINESKFSSTPEYGMFGDEPKSFGVSNVISVLLSSEEQMISVAGISDNDANIRYLSTKPMLLDQDAVMAELLEKAMQKAKEKAATYQKALNVTLVPVEVLDSTYGAPEPDVNPQSRMSKVSSYSNNKPDSFGSTKLHATVTIRYKLLAN